jgi:hypothetical protein
MGHRNVTVSLPDELLREARHMAVDQGLSLSRFLAALLEERVALRRQYRAARERQRRLLEEGLPSGTQGRIGWGREDPHERWV